MGSRKEGVTEQGRVHHVGTFPELEEQLCEWSPEDSGKSPDRLDALVWLVTVLLEKGRVCRSSYMPEFFRKRIGSHDKLAATTAGVRERVGKIGGMQSVFHSMRESDILSRQI